MLKVQFVNDSFGHIEPDANALNWARDVVRDHNNTSENLTATVATSVLVNAFRVLIVRGEISHEEVVFLYKDHVMHPDAYGALDSWPKGFCDVNDNFLEELITSRLSP